MVEEKTDEFGTDRAAFLDGWPKDSKGNFAKPFVGTILDSEVIEDVEGLGGQARDVPLFTVVDDDGAKWTIWGSGMLARVLPRHVGHRVRIEDKGLGERREDGTQLRSFDVRCATCTAEGR